MRSELLMNLTRMEQRQKEKREIRDRLESEFSTKENPKAERLFELAWDYGHSSGENEVHSYYIEMLDLIT